MFHNFLRHNVLPRWKARPRPAGWSGSRGGHEECRLKPPNPYHDPHHDQSINGNHPRCMAGRRHTVTMANGVGVGPELMAIVKRVLYVANAPVCFEVLDLGADATDVDVDNLIYSVERNGVCVKWNLEPQREPEKLSRNMQLTRALDLYVNLIHIHSYPALQHKAGLQTPVDVVLMRQNMEGEYAMLEHEHDCRVEHLKITTEYNCRRLAEFAFEYARANNRPRVRLIHHKEFLQESEDLFVNTVSKVAERYKDIKFVKDSMRKFASNMCHFGFNGDVLVTSVLYGAIIFNLMSGLLRTPGVFCGQQLGERYAVFEPATRIKGTKLAGRDRANPVGALMSGVLLLRYLGHHASADAVQKAVELTINEDQVHTRDIDGGTASTEEVVRNVERRVRELVPPGHWGSSR